MWRSAVGATVEAESREKAAGTGLQVAAVGMDGRVNSQTEDH